MTVLAGVTVKPLQCRLTCTHIPQNIRRLDAVTKANFTYIFLYWLKLYQKLVEHNHKLCPSCSFSKSNKRSVKVSLFPEALKQHASYAAIRVGTCIVNRLSRFKGSARTLASYDERWSCNVRNVPCRWPKLTVTENSEGEWLVDSGASVYRANDISILISIYTDRYRTNVQIADKVRLKLLL